MGPDLAPFKMIVICILGLAVEDGVLGKDRIRCDEHEEDKFHGRSCLRSLSISLH